MEFHGGLTLGRRVGNPKCGPGGCQTTVSCVIGHGIRHRLVGGGWEFFFLCHPLSSAPHHPIPPPNRHAFPLLEILFTGHGVSIRVIMTVMGSVVPGLRHAQGAAFSSPSRGLHGQTPDMSWMSQTLAPALACKRIGSSRACGVSRAWGATRVLRL